MKILNWSVLLIVLVLVVSATPITPSTPSVFISSFENVLGTSFDLKVRAQNESQADEAERVALAEIDRLNSILSSYDPNSEFSQWSRTLNQDIKVSRELFEVLSLFEQWQSRTSGALNAAAGQVTTLWKKAEHDQRLPLASEINDAVKMVKQENWVLNANTQTATHLSQVPLLMNSFVKSYIIRKVADKVMAVKGISTALVNIGGDILLEGDQDENIFIANPHSDNGVALAKIKVNGQAIATSGNYKRGYSIDGNWYSHIVDPRTGWPAQKIISATVVAPDAVDAGALATAFNILEPGEARKLAGQMNGVEFLIITADGKRIESDGWENLVVKDPFVSPVKKSHVQKPWNSEYEVSLNLELMRFEGRSRRPFVAIWVEDAQKKTVKTLALWFNKPRWLPDLKEWFHKNSDTYQNGSKDVFSIGSATRPAGNYTIKWDGKNDNGDIVSEGNYTIYIEVAREHGTYQLMKQELVCKNKAQHFVLPANEEVASATVDYKKLSN